MKSWLKAMWTDAATFKGACLAVIGIGGAAVAAGNVPNVPDWMGYVLVSASSLLNPGKRQAAEDPTE